MNTEALLLIATPLGLFLAALYIPPKEPRQKRTIPLYPPPRGTKWEINTDHLPGTIELRLMRRFPFTGTVAYTAVYSTSNDTLTDREVWNYSKRLAEEHERRNCKIRITKTHPK